MKPYVNAVLPVLLTLISIPALAQDRGDRINDRLDERGERINARLDHRAENAATSGHTQRAEHLDAKGDRVERKLDRRGNRIDRRLDRRPRHPRS